MWSWYFWVEELLTRSPAKRRVPPMLYRMVIWRLRHFADECQRASQSAVDPATRKELEHFEKLFQQSALEIETARDNERRSG